MLLELPLHVGRESCHSRPILIITKMLLEEKVYRPNVKYDISVKVFCPKLNKYVLVCVETAKIYTMGGLQPIFKTNRAIPRCGNFDTCRCDILSEAKERAKSIILEQTL